MNSKKSKNIRTITLFLITMLCFGAMGYCIGMLIKQDGRHANHIILLRLGYSMLWAFIGIFASVIIHESGHLVMGLRSGYDFVSFRIGSFVWIKQDGKLVCKKMSIQGTAGQCLLMPKQDVNPEDVPYKTYFIGGGLFNLITAAITFPLFALAGNFYLKMPLFMLAVFSVYLGLINLIPMSGNIANDGYNCLSLNKHPGDKIFIYNQLTVNGLMTQGLTPLEIDPKYFEVPEGLSDIYVVAAALMKASVLITEHEYAQARDIISESLKTEDTMKIYISEAKCELIFCECMLGSPREQIDKLLDRELKAYIKAASKTLISKPRVMYAYYKLCAKDEAAAKAEYDKAMKLQGSYAIPGELKCELELIGEVTRRSEDNAQ